MSRVGDDPPSDLHPVDVGQRRIEQEHVGVDLSGQGDGLPPSAADPATAMSGSASRRA